MIRTKIMTNHSLFKCTVLKIYCSFPDQIELHILELDIAEYDMVKHTRFKPTHLNCTGIEFYMIKFHDAEVNTVQVYLMLD